MNKKLVMVVGLSWMMLHLNTVAAEAGGDVRAEGGAEVGDGAAARAEVSVEIRAVVTDFQQERENFLAAQRELRREIATATQERRAQIREELARMRGQASTLRREFRESVQNVTTQAREQARRVEAEVRAEASAAATAAAEVRRGRRE